jgi:hypothetical protein
MVFDLPSVASALLFLATCVQVACMAPKKIVGKQATAKAAAKRKAAAKPQAKAAAASSPDREKEEKPAPETPPTTPGDDDDKKVKDELMSPGPATARSPGNPNKKRMKGNPLDKSALIKLRNGLKSWLRCSDERKREVAQRQLDVLDAGSHADRQDLIESFLAMGSSLRGEAALKWATSYAREKTQIQDESKGQAWAWRTLEGILTANDLTIGSFSSVDKAFQWAEFEAMECLKREGKADIPQYQPKIVEHEDKEFTRASSKYWYTREMETTLTTSRQESKKLKGITHGTKMDGLAMQVALSDEGAGEPSDSNRAAAEHSCRVSKTSGA